MKIQELIDPIYDLLQSHIYERLTSISNSYDKYQPCIDIYDNIYVEYSKCDKNLSYTNFRHDADYLNVYICENEIRIMFRDRNFNLSEPSKFAYFDINNTEEDLFMLSTIQDNFDITIKDINLFRNISLLYFNQT